MTMEKKITKITPQQKATSRYNIFVNEEFFCGVTEDTLIEMNLKKGMILSEDLVSKLNNSENKNRCFSYCIWLLGRKGYFEKELRDKLLRKEDFSDNDIDFAIDKLKECGYLNDENRARSLVNDKKNFSKKGPRYIALDLMRKGVDRDVIEEALEENYSEEDQLENCVYLARKKYSSYSKKESDPYKLKSKVYGSLAQKGFSSSIITQAISEILSEED